MSVEFRILDNIYPLDTTYGVTSTSEDSDFPASNLQDPRRAKVWHSSGHFVIDSTNNALDFAEPSGGVELNATISSGTYTPSELATEIKTQLDATGGGTYSVSYSDSTGKWTITYDSGGDPDFDLLWSTGTNTATSIGDTLGFDTSSDDTAALTYTGDSIAIHTLERVVFDLKSSALGVDSAVVLFPYTGSQLTSSATVTLKANATNGGWDSPSLSQSLTLDEQSGVYSHFFTSDENYRYWAVEIVDPENPDLYVSLGNVAIASATNLDRAPASGFTYRLRDTSDLSENDFGVRFFDTRPTFQELDFDMPLLTYQQAETLMDIFNRIGRQTPVIVSLDTTEQIFDKDRILIYGHLQGDMSFQHRVRNIFDLSLSIEEAF